MPRRTSLIRLGRAALALALGAVVVFVSPVRPQDNLGRGRISGNVADEKGNAVEGVNVAVQCLTAPTLMKAVTDAKGHFAVGGLGSGAWKITATKDGYAPSSLEINVSQLRANPPSVITLKKLAGVEALKADKDSSALFDKGNQLFAQGDYDGAIRIFEEIQSKYPEIYQVHLNLGSNYLRKGDLDKAESEYQLVLDKTLQAFGSYQKDPKASFRGFSGLGEVAIKRNDLDTAQKRFQQALEISPLDQTAAYNVGEIFFSNQKIDEAIKYFELAIQIKKDWSKPYQRLGMVYLNKGDYAKALDYLNAFITMDPTNAEAPNAKSMISAIEKIKK